MVSRPLQDRYLVPTWEMEEWAQIKLELYAAMVVWSVHGICCDATVWWFTSIEDAHLGV